MRKRWLGVGLAAGVLVVTAALPFITHSASGPALRMKGDPDAGISKPSTQTAVGPNELRTADDTAEAQEAYWRAYPASVDEISFAATLKAQAAFAEIKAREERRRAWHLIGPSKATYPGVLNVLNDGDQYVASGRTIAMAIGPSCTKARCPLYIGAAGGGVWRTDKALQGPNWEFVSGSFATERDRDARDRPERPEREHDLRRDGRAQRVRRLRGRDGHLQVDERRRHLDAPARQRHRALELPGARGQRHHDRAERRHHRRRRAGDPRLLGQHRRRNVQPASRRPYRRTSASTGRRTAARRSR